MEKMEKMDIDRDFLDRVINAIPNPVFVKDAAHRIMLVNDVACRTMGRKREDMLGKTDYNLFPREQADSYFERDRRIFDTKGAEVNIEERAWDGVTHTILTTESAFHDPSSNEDYILGISEDITAIRRAEDAVRLRDKAMSLAINAIVFIDPAANITYVNDSFLDMWGYTSRDEVTGKQVADFYEDTRDIKLGIKVLRDEGRWIGELIGLRKDGATFDAHVSATVIRDENDEITCLMVSVVDVTERNSMAERLKQSETLYRTIFENTGTATIIIDGDMGICMVNEEFEKSYGYTAEELEGKVSVLDLIDVSDVEKAKEYSRLRRIDADAVPRSYEIGVNDKKGDKKDIFLTVALIPGTDRSVVSFQDITEIRKSEMEQKRQKDLLLRTNKALEHKITELKDASRHIKRLEGLVPICASCKKMLREEGDSKDQKSWVTMEKYISDRTDANFTHGFCPECMNKIYKQRS